VICRFTLGQYIVMAAFTGTNDLVMINSRVGNPGIGAMTGFAEIGSRWMISWFTRCSDAVMTSYATLISDHAVVH